MSLCIGNKNNVGSFPRPDTCGQPFFNNACMRANASGVARILFRWGVGGQGEWVRQVETFPTPKMGNGAITSRGRH